MKRLLDILKWIVVFVVMTIILSGYIKGSVNRMGGEARIEFYDVIFTYKESIEEKVSKKKMIKREDLNQFQEAISEHTPFVDDYEESIKYKLADIYELLVEEMYVGDDRWTKAEEYLEELNRMLFSAGFDMEYPSSN